MKRKLLLFLLVSLWVTPFSWTGQGFGKNKDLTVTTMTQNMFPGANLDPILSAGSDFDLSQAAAAIASQVIASNIPGRAALVAAEIAENQADLVALQEATKWKFKSGHGMIVLDQLDLLMDALKKAGQHYRVAAVQELTDVQIKGLISYTDRDAILVRTDRPLNVVGSETHLFDAESLLSFSFMGGTIQVLRGWMAVDVKLRGSRFKFVNTHLESPLPEPPDALAYTQYLQFLQAQQLVSELSAASIPIILAGDFNSAADSTGQYPADETPSYSLLVAPIQLGGGGYADPWHELNGTEPGYTWPLVGLDPSGNVFFPNPFERIDLILSNGPDAFSMKTIGTDFSVFPASDHAGVIAMFQLADPR
jgi:endonuclease/exonuclease/phosphatase family metal-dependent hydrolase